MKITQENVNDVEKWAESMRDLYIQKGLELAATLGFESLREYLDAAENSESDEDKSLAQLREEWQAAEVFYRDARQILNAGRQGG
ncbi:MAG: hypothetical protein JKY12_01480 [Sneathiella sp.]|nr:hypothetical protein [Sneathiella sp.]